MKLSISNIAWDKAHDEEMYLFLSSIGFDGLEIAPTRIWTSDPYNQIDSAVEYKKRLFEKYGLVVSSMQSIWFGKTERIFGAKEERDSLIEYTKKAYEFAHALGCNNLVFGCPRNRIVPEIAKNEVASIIEEFFGRLSILAVQNDVVLAIEANPTIYNTNFINYTKEAYDLVKQIDKDGLRLNYDLGTVIYNKEKIEDLENYISLINHIHISEPKLAMVSFGDIHKKMHQIVNEAKYEKFVSIEMGNIDDITRVKECCLSLKEIFRG